MSGPSEEILIQRKLRAAEIALETARRRRFERDEEVRDLQAQISGLEAALAALEGAREGDRARAEEQVAAARRAQLEAEQLRLGERARRLALENELTALRAEVTRRDVLSRQLEAERGLRAARGEAEMVSRRAAEFEYAMRIAALDAFGVVRELSDRVGALLAAVGIGPGPRTPEATAPAAEPAGAASSDAHEGSAATAPAEVTPHPADGITDGEEGLDFARLDAALERLRAAAPRPDSES